jgi:D-sedoheptulose 7-phosphate isomerase
MKYKSKFYIDELISRYPNLFKIKSNIVQAINIMKKTSLNGGKYLICGNGGSAADSNHIVGELMKGFALDRKINTEIQYKIKKLFSLDADYLINNLQQGISAISLTSHTALTSAFSNDKVSDLIFAQQVFGYGQEKDVLLAISTSGNSKNIIHAAQIAKVLGIKVISLTGENGGELRKLSDVLINVPEKETFKVQELHLPIYHAICLILEYELFGGL